MKYKIMRMMCLFDLPVDTEEQRRSYRTFRKNLIKEGFTMIQYSVYVRTCPSREYADRLEKRIQKFVPREGNIRIINITEKQYQDMKLFVGKRTNSELNIGTERLVVL